MTLTTTIYIDHNGDHASGYRIERHKRDAIRYDFLYEPISDQIRIKLTAYRETLYNVMYLTDVHDPKAGKLNRIIRVEPKLINP